MAFDKTYWDKNYSEPETMDGIGNADAHVLYLKALIDIEHVDISSVIDLGFGYGYLFKEVLKAFKPHTAVGIEPSEHAFKAAKKLKLKPVSSTHLDLYQMDLLTWVREQRAKTLQFDLAICTSVFQYISDKDLQEILPVLAKKVKFIYLTAPTDTELKKQIEDLDFKDEYAIHRTREKYHKLIRPHFTFISSRFLESKHFFNEETTPFTDHLFRY